MTILKYVLVASNILFACLLLAVVLGARIEGSQSTAGFLVGLWIASNFASALWIARR